jgi:MFS family permease
VALAITIATDRRLPQPPAERTPVAGRARAALAYARGYAAVRTLLGLHAAAIVIFTITVPVEIVFATHDLHSGARGYGLLLSAWGAGAVAGSAVFVRWHRLPNRLLMALGAALLGGGLLIAGLAPTLAVAVGGIGLGGMGNGIYVVAARTALQEAVEERWMAMMMSFNESMLEALPGVGIVVGGALAALASARFALALAGGGGLLIAGVVWLALRPAQTGTPVAQVGGR